MYVHVCTCSSRALLYTSRIVKKDSKYYHVMVMLGVTAVDAERRLVSTNDHHHVIIFTSSPQLHTRRGEPGVQVYIFLLMFRCIVIGEA